MTREKDHEAEPQKNKTAKSYQIRLSFLALCSDSSLRQNNLNWNGLSVQACHSQLFSSLDFYLQPSISQL